MSAKTVSSRFPKKKLIEFCQQHHIRKLAVFGSALRDDFSVDSDLDILVEFAPERAPGLAFFAMQDELSILLNRPVDLNTPQFLSPYFREQALKQALIIYDAA